MNTLRSYVNGRWHTAPDATARFATLVNPATEEPIARASTDGIDFGDVLAHAHDVGGPALRACTVAERAAMLKAASKALYEHRDELLALSVANAGTTRKDAKFDVDGATGTLAYYASLGKAHGGRRWLPDGEGVQLGRTPRFWGQHAWVPKTGAAVHINAFNFPAWGFAEKAAVAWLAGMPVVTKPATSTALLTERAIEILIDAGVVPEGALQLVCGSTGDLLSRLGSGDVLAFTGSADTGLKLRSGANLLERNTAVNLEADSLNAAVLAPDVEPGDDTWDLFVRDVHREIHQKTGQKCTAVRRIFVPRERLDDVRDALADRLDGVVTGNPEDPDVTMGPLATAQQLDDVLSGIRTLAGGAKIVYGTGERHDGRSAEPGRGYFVTPTLLAAPDLAPGGDVHRLEVFGPVATLLPYDGPAEVAADAVAAGGGCLVTSLYSDDGEAVAGFLGRGGAACGRLYLGSKKMADQAPGSGVALPQSLHGGPGRAGGGEELGGERALSLYSQRVALQGSRPMLERLIAGDD